MKIAIASVGSVIRSSRAFLGNLVFRLVLLTALPPALPALAGAGANLEGAAGEDSAAEWEAEISTGWDSLYMWDGVNVLRDGQPYGSGLYWTDLNGTLSLTDSDFLSADAWVAFGFDRTDYKELDVYIGYTRTINNLALDFGYTFYDIYSGPFYSHELNWKAGYTFDLLGGITVTPSISYSLNLGPDVADGEGITKTGAGFLRARVDAAIPVNQSIFSIKPWFAFGASFDYNFKENGSYYTGANNLEAGIGVSVRITDSITIYNYCAYSTQWAGLLGTLPNTFWSGIKITFAFR